MTDYLDRLGAELDDASRRIHRAGRLPRRRIAGPVAAAGATLAALAVVALGLGAVGDRDGRPAVPAAAPPRAAATVPPPGPGLADVRLLVANASTVDGVAGDYAARLRARGWRVLPVANGPERHAGATAVVALRGDVALARRVADRLGIATVREPTDFERRAAPREAAAMIALAPPDAP